jgi:TrmH family RNA methyltransferase
MLGKSKIKLINSLSRKKYRDKTGLFIVEGRKGIEEFLDSGFVPEQLFTEKDVFPKHAEKTETLTPDELKKISNLTTPQGSLAIFKIPKASFPKSNFVLALDGVRDPGNLGTIIRLCDWFGVRDLVCSEDCVDCFNPKTVQATMGSLARVNVFYTDLKNFVQNTPLPVYGTFMDGENVYSTEVSQNGILILGNEANGISLEIEKLVERKLSIPRFGKLKKTESLNVASAAAIFLSEARRSMRL